MNYEVREDQPTIKFFTISSSTDMNDEEVCFIYEPGTEYGDSRRPSKRRKTSDSDDSERETAPFKPLLRGGETSLSVTQRFRIFKDNWEPKEAKCLELLREANAKTTRAVKGFVQRTPISSNELPTGLLRQGASSGVSASLPDSIIQELQQERDVVCVSLNSTSGSNLKSLLKSIVSQARDSIQNKAVETTEALYSKSQFLNYDLASLFECLGSRSDVKVVLLFRDSESFEGGLLGDILELLSSWNDRIHFTLLFCITTSIDLFQAKLSRAAVKRLRGQVFEVENFDLEQIFRLVLEDGSFFLGPNLSKAILARHSDYVENPAVFISTLKYSHMAHYFANPLSLWLGDDMENSASRPETLAALREAPSFCRWIEDLIDNGDQNMALDYLEDSRISTTAFITAFEMTRRSLVDVSSTVTHLHRLLGFLSIHHGRKQVKWSEIYILAMSNQLLDSTLIAETWSMLKRVDSGTLQKLSVVLLDWQPDDFVQNISAKLDSLVTEAVGEAPIRSSYQTQISNLRTTVVAHKVELSRKEARLSPSEAAYTKVLDDFVGHLSASFRQALINPHELFLHEALIYDGRLQHREGFLPRPRFAIERALSSPHDYLGCTCCDDAGVALSASQPALAIVYQLYLESGGIINTADLWSAFWTIVKPDGGDEEDGEQEKALALFSRSLAELKYLGMVKNSRKKPDHLAKLVWRGL